MGQTSEFAASLLIARQAASMKWACLIVTAAGLPALFVNENGPAQPKLLCHQNSAERAQVAHWVTSGNVES